VHQFSQLGAAVRDVVAQPFLRDLVHLRVQLPAECVHAVAHVEVALDGSHARHGEVREPVHRDQGKQPGLDLGKP
jgi:hypothetical protein